VGGRDSLASASGHAVGFSLTPPLSVSEGIWRDATQDRALEAHARRRAADGWADFYDDYFDSYTCDDEGEAQPPVDARIACHPRYIVSVV
jgi:hypothetical protein